VVLESLTPQITGGKKAKRSGAFCRPSAFALLG